MRRRKSLFQAAGSQSRARLYRRSEAADSCLVLETRLLLTAVTLTDNEQLLLELINRARSNPTAEATRYGISLNAGLPAGSITTAPKQPLVAHQSLVNAAGLHALDMLNRDYFSHTTLGSGDSPGDRAVAAGYPTDLVGENIAWGGSTGVIDQVQAVYDRHRGLFLSAGHRENMLTDWYEEVGTGVRYGQFTDEGTTYNASMVAESFADRQLSPFITGVIFTDTNSDQFYSIGEAVRSGTVTVTNTSTGAVLSAPIGSSGGYSISAVAGTYTVSASYLRAGSTRNVVRSGTVTVSEDNVKVDFETTAAESVQAGLTWSVAVTSLNELGDWSTAPASLTRSGSLTSAITVSLVSSDTTELTVPATVSFAVGQQTASFMITAVSDGIIDGAQTARLTASVSGLSSGVISLSVSDRTAPRLPTAQQIVVTSRPVFSWTAVSNAVSYEIWVNNSSTGQTGVIRQSGITTTSYTPTVDLGLGSYFVWVRAFSASGATSIWSEAGTWRVRTPTVISSPVRTVSSGSFNVEWSAVVGAVSYDVWVDRLSSGTSQYYRNSAVAGTSVSLTGFDIGRYGIWVRGRNSSGEVGSWSSSSVVTVSIPVTNVNVQASSINSPAALNWAAVAGATLYDVWVNNLTTGLSQAVRNTAVAGNSLSLSSLGAGAYRAWVRARDVSGASAAWSLPLDFDIQKAPRLLSVVASGQAGRPIVSWSPVAGAGSYELWVSNAAGARVVTQTISSATSYTPAAPLAAGTYRAWIRALDSSGTITGWSTSLSFTVAVDSSESSDSGFDDRSDRDALFASGDLNPFTLCVDAGYRRGHSVRQDRTRQDVPETCRHERLPLTDSTIRPDSEPTGDGDTGQLEEFSGASLILSAEFSEQIQRPEDSPKNRRLPETVE